MPLFRLTKRNTLYSILEYWDGLPRSTAVTLFAKFSWITMGGSRWRLASLTNIVLASDSPMWPSWNCSESKNQTIKGVRLLAGACCMITLCGSLGIRPTQEAKLSLSNCMKPRKNTSAVSQYCPGSYIWPSIGHLVQHSSFWAISSNQRRLRVPSGQSFICASLTGRWGRNANFRGAKSDLLCNWFRNSGLQIRQHFEYFQYQKSG